MVGIGPDTFAPDMILNRETAATALTRVFKKWYFDSWTLDTDTHFNLSYTRPPMFTDDAMISSWALDSVYFMAANGILLGMGDGSFAPNNPNDDPGILANATREQALVIALRMVMHFKDEKDLN